MTPQEFGDHLRRYLGQYSRSTLAKEMFQDGRFAPQGMDSPDDLQQLVQDTEAGHRWPYSKRDFTDFLEVVVACGPVLSSTMVINLKADGADYSTQLDPWQAGP